MGDFYRERQIKKTKKEHRCFGCRGKIPAGSSCFYITFVNDGDFGAEHLCNKCKSYLINNPEFGKDGYEEGGIRDAMLEDEEWRKQRGKDAVAFQIGKRLRI